MAQAYECRSNYSEQILLAPRHGSWVVPGKLCPDQVGTAPQDSRGTWRKRVGVEPTIQPAKGRIAGFEGREGHRTLFASAGIIEAIWGPFNFSGRTPIKVQKMAMRETLAHTLVTCTATGDP